MIYLQAVSALALVIGLIGLFYFLTQRLNDRFTGGSSKRQIKVIERTAIGEKRSLLLVRVGQQQLLLGATNSAISLLSTVPVEESAESIVPEKEGKKPLPSKVSFRKILGAIR